MAAVPEKSHDELVLYMHEWLRYFGDPQFPGRSLYAKIMLSICQSKLSLMALATGMGLYLLDALGTASMSEAVIAIRFIIGTYSGAAAVFTLSRSSEQLAGVIRTIAHLATTIEAYADDKYQDGTHRVVQRNRKQVQFYNVYSTCTQMGTFFTIFTMRQHWIQTASGWLYSSVGIEFTEEDLREGPASVWIYRVTALLQCQVSSTVVYALIVFFLPYTLLVYDSLAEMQHQIGRILETRPCCPLWASLQRDVLKACLLANEAMEGPLPHILVAAFVLPLLSTVDLVINGSEADGYALVIAPVIIVVFMPVCETGNALYAAREGITDRAFCGPWLEEDRFQHQLRLCMMLLSHGRGALLRGMGIGILDRSSFGNSMRGWFSFLQAVLNLRRRI